MKLTGELKEKVEKAENTAEAKDIIAEADVELTDEEVDNVAGGRLSTRVGDPGNSTGFVNNATIGNMGRRN